MKIYFPFILLWLFSCATPSHLILNQTRESYQSQKAFIAFQAEVCDGFFEDYHESKILLLLERLDKPSPLLKVPVPVSFSSEDQLDPSHNATLSIGKYCQQLALLKHQEKYQSAGFAAPLLFEIEPGEYQFKGAELLLKTLKEIQIKIVNDFFAKEEKYYHENIIPLHENHYKSFSSLSFKIKPSQILFLSYIRIPNEYQKKDSQESLFLFEIHEKPAHPEAWKKILQKFPKHSFVEQK